MIADAIRKADRRPTMHPYAKHRTAAGPARVSLVKDGVIVHVGMRRYSPVYVGIPGRVNAESKHRIVSNRIMAALWQAWRA